MTSDANKKWWIFAAMMLLLGVLNVDFTIVNLAVPTIARSLNSSLTEMQWVLTAYIISSAIFMSVGGRVGDIIGKNKTYLLGTSIFTTASFAAGLSNTDWLLILFRAIQGIGFGFTLPIIVTIIFDSFPIKQRSLAVSMLSTIAGITQAIGPTLGGLILEIANWHWVFLINVPLCIVSAYIVIKKYKKDEPLAKDESLDAVGILLLAFGLGSILIAANELNRWSGLYILSAFVFGIIFITLFVLHERKCKEPLINLTFFRNSSYTSITSIRLLLTFTFFSFLFLMPLFLQGPLSYSPLASGFILLFATGAMGVIAPFAGKLYNSLGYKRLLFMSYLFFVIGFAILGESSANTPLILIIIALIFLGIGVGVSTPTCTTTTLSTVEPETVSVASGIYYTGTTATGSFGTALAGSSIIIFSSLFLNQHLNPAAYTPTQWQLIHSTTHGLHPSTYLFKYFPSAAATQLEPIVKAAFTRGFNFFMLLNLFIVGITLLITLRTKITLRPTRSHSG